ncbi:heavy metal-responsive transcriptional regulator [Xanthomonas cerealis pv. cerealis]|uniref:Heavy metal-responsive transcriptional regulator n=1 Tax=Xanthomonas cerealis pv. cerealis TaxID=152263 RepID=A0A514EFE7_9XANT|nr:heavy metal-responsive transcriptional regulator [Xanthomonas translucens]QDI04721.1 heavy metal-responsive transcriptional regulator [Xanthomonas translucens pv. cerealis]
MNPVATPSRFTIGALARQADVAIDTVRYYERQGLLPAPPRRASGYRDYDAAAVERVRCIRRAKDLGFSLEEIGDLLALQDDRLHGVEGIKQRASERVHELDRRIAQLTEMRDALAALVAECPGRGEPACCPILGDIRGDIRGGAAPGKPQP